MGVSSQSLPEGFLPGVSATLVGALSRALASVDADLCAQAAVAPTNSVQNHLLESVAGIRLGRLGLVDEVTRRVAGIAGPGLPPARFPDPSGDLCELVDMDAVIPTVRQQGGVMLTVMAGRVPVDPDSLARLFLGWCSQRHFDAPVTLLLFRRFRACVLDVLPDWCRQWAAKLGMDVESATPVAAEAEAAVDVPLLFAVLEGLQQEQALAFRQARASGVMSQPVDAGMERLRLRLAAAGCEPDREVLEDLRLVARLFEFILKDPNLPPSVQGLLGYLQVPVTRVALLDPGFFSREGHPARKLLNQIATASLALGREAGRGDVLFEAMADAVGQVLQSFAGDTSLFTDVLARFTGVQEREAAQALLAEERVRSAETMEARTALARGTVTALLASVQADDTLPVVIRQFLAQRWHQVLFLAVQQGGAGGEKWQQHCQTMDDLVWSVRPITSPADRQKLLRLVPGLLKSLRTGLIWAGQSQGEMDDFFKALESIHLSLLRSKPQPVEPVVAEASPAPVTEAVADEPIAVAAALAAETGAPVAVADAVSAEAPEPAAPAAAGDEQALEEARRIVDSLSNGIWVEFCESEDKRFRCKLAAVIKHTGRYVFVNRSGVKVAEKTRDELVQELHDGKVRLLDESRLFDRALESVIGAARQRNA